MNDEYQEDFQEEPGGYDEEEPAQWDGDQEEWDGVSEPQPADFEDYDEYVKSRIDWRLTQAGGPGPSSEQVRQEIAGAVREGLKPPPQPLHPLPDDELLGPRQDAISWIADCRQKEQECRIKGDTKGIRAWQERAQWGVKDIEKLGPSLAEKAAEELSDISDYQNTSKLFDEYTADDPAWDSPRMKHDASIVVNRTNQRSRNGVICLPQESSPYGEVLEVHPKNMCHIQLPPTELARYKAMVFSSGGDPSPKATFKRSWEALHKLGYASQAVPSYEAKSGHSEGEPDPDKMNWAEFCKWREAQENKRRGGPRKGFAFPKKRQHGNP
ncbi:hypothetical protein ACFL4N_03780 [Thermodesulfobacteriota bacterium]